MRFSNFALSGKLAVGFGAVLAIVAISSAVTVTEMRQVAEIERFASVSNAAIDRIDQIGGDLSEARSGVRKFVLTGEPSDKAKTEASLAEMDKDLSAFKDILAKDGPQFLPDLADYQAKVQVSVRKGIQPELDLASDAATRPQAVAMVSSSATGPYLKVAAEAFKALRLKVEAWSDGWTDAGNRAMQQIQWVAAGAGIVSILLGLVMAWVIVRAIGRPLSAMTAAMDRLASGDTGIAVPALGQTDEVGQMASTVQVFKEAAVEKIRLEKEAVEARRHVEEERAGNEAARAAAARDQAHVVASIATGLERLAEGDLAFRLNDPFAYDSEKLRSDFNGAMAKLAETMTVVNANATAIRSGTQEISAASDDLARRTEQQAASLEETTAALGEITSTVRQTAEGATHAHKVVGAAKKDAEQSGVVVGQAVDAMGEIEKSSGQISQIISVIDEIAFQTNLLALNAGVEAARAGDAGRGFAVVASEVRALAQRSAEAAKEIKALILASSQQVATGVTLVGKTGKALECIVAQITDINAVVTRIASSAHEQATALDQINTAVVQMDQVTQQNAAMVEQATAASHSLSQEADALTRLVSQFRTGQDRSGEVVRALPRKAAAKPVARALAALKTVGRGGAARKPEPAADGGAW